MRAIFTLAAKDMRLLMRDRVGFFFVFFFPLLMAVFFGTIFAGGGGGSSRGIPVAVVMEDHGEEAEAFANKLDRGAQMEVTRVEGRADAADMVRRGKLTAFIVIEEGFSEASRRIFWGEPMRLSLGVDPSRSAEAAMLEGLLTAAAFEEMQSKFGDTQTMSGSARDALASLRSADAGDVVGREVLEQFLVSLDTFLVDMPAADEEAADGGGGLGNWNPIAIMRSDINPRRDGMPTSSYAISFPQGIIWGLIGCAAGFGISLVTERTRGTLVRLRMAPLPSWHVLAGKGLACFATTVGVTSLLLLVARFVFGVQPGSVALLAAAVVCSAVAFVGIMMLLSVLGKTEAAAGGIGWAVLLVMAMLGGGMMPLFLMPGWMQTVSHISPVKWAVLALEGAIWRGFSPAEMALPCAVLLAVGATGFALGSRLFQWSEE